MAELEGEPLKKLKLATSQKEQFKYANYLRVWYLLTLRKMQCGPWNVSVSGALPEMGVHDEDSCPLDLLEIQNPTELDK